MPNLLPDAGPQRVLAASNFVYTIGSGLYLTAGVLYFTQSVRLPAAQVGLGLGIAGFVSLALGIGAGHLADRYGARGVYAATLVVRAAATACFVLADSFWPFVLAVCAATGAQAAGVAARSPLIRHYGGDRPQEFRAYLRSVTNVGISLGALLAGWAVQVGTHSAYELLVLGIAASTAASAVVLVRLPAVAPAPATGGGPQPARPAGPPLPPAHRPRRRDGHPVQGADRGPAALAGRGDHRAALAHLGHHARQHRDRHRVPGTGQPRHRLPHGRMEAPTAGQVWPFSSPAH